MDMNICLAGTFNTLHAGHEALLRKAFEVGERVLIGITSDRFVSSYKSPKSPRSLRQEKLEKWLESHGYLSRSTIIPIDDPYEPAASDSTLEALVVSEETKERGEELNQIRLERGLKPLALIVVPMISANGKLVLPVSLRSELAKPLGQIIKKINFVRGRLAKLNIITVGDVTTKTFLDAGIVPQLMIIDHKVNRKPFISIIPPSLYRRISVVSGPGYIAREALEAIQDAMQTNQSPMLLEVDGEEDLLVLPAVSDAPIGSVVYYGQPGEGMVEVVVTEKKKHEVTMLLDKFR